MGAVGGDSQPATGELGRKPAAVARPQDPAAQDWTLMTSQEPALEDRSTCVLSGDCNVPGQDHSMWQVRTIVSQDKSTGCSKVCVYTMYFL